MLQPNQQFYITMRVYKTGGAAVKLSNLCTNDLVINGLTFVNSTAAFNSMSSQNIIMKGNFNYYGTFDFTLLSNTGSCIFDGASQTINNYSSGSGIFNNVVFSSSIKYRVATGICQSTVTLLSIRVISIPVPSILL